MTLYEELKARGLVAQITDEEIIDLINNGKATFYIGFDCTADSLTAGHFLALTQGSCSNPRQAVSGAWKSQKYPPRFP